MTKQFKLAQQSILTFVATRDPDRAKKFYRDTLGLPLVSEELPFALVFDVNGTMLRVCENLRLLLVFGPILWPDGSTGNLAQFLKQHALNHGFTVLEKSGLQHTKTGRMFFLHEADTRDKESVISRVVKNLSAYRNDLRSRLEHHSGASPT